MEAASELAGQASKAAEEILAGLNESDDQYDGQIASKTLTVLAAHELLSYGFLDPSNTGPQPGDIEKVCAVIAALGEQSSTVATVFMLSGVLCPLCVSLLGSPEQKARLLPLVASGGLQMSFALTEPEAGSDAGAAKTQAVPVGEGYVLRGEKIYITGSATADFVLTVARTSDQNAKAFGVFLVHRRAPGLTVAPLSKMAGNGHASCHLKFDDVAVSADDLLGGAQALESAWKIMRITGMLERLIVAASSCGLARAATRRSTTFIKERRQFGQLLNSFQSIQHTVVEMSTLTTAMDAMVEHALRVYASGHDPTEAISKAKYFCSEQLQRVVEMALRVMGGRAYFDFEPVSRYYREAPLSLFAGGTVEIQKMLIARSLGI